MKDMLMQSLTDKSKRNKTSAKKIAHKQPNGASW